MDKEPKSRNKRIDPVDAAIDAHVAYMKYREDLDINGETEKYLAMMGWE